jgi:hypothetical protein
VTVIATRKKRGRPPLGSKAMTDAERAKRYRARLKRQAKPQRKAAERSHPHYRGYDDFVPAFNAARHAAIAAYGERWALNPDARVWARLPAAWVTVKLSQGRTSTAPRDQRLPAARFWPKGRLPIGPEYAEPAPPAMARIDIIDISQPAKLSDAWRQREREYRATGRSPHQKRAA